MKKTNDNSISINKYVSSTGICSRREADRWIEAGRIRINGKVAKLGNRVFSGDNVHIDGQHVKAKAKPLYIAFNKPIGIVSTTDSKDSNNIVDYINHPQRLFSIGRLDKASEGLIFLTNDGDIVNKILRAGNRHEKEYIVTVKEAITSNFLQKMSQGVPILGTVTKKCQITRLNTFTFKIILTQGLNRQIRRMCEHLGYHVSHLQRTRIMNVQIGKLKAGQWRKLTDSEMQEIQKSIRHSSKTEEASKDTHKGKTKKSNFSSNRTPSKAIPTPRKAKSTPKRRRNKMTSKKKGILPSKKKK